MPKFDARKFEHSDPLLRNTWTVIRVYGQDFSKFAAAHSFVRPVDQRCVDLTKRVRISVAIG
jgi:tRNA(His) 5'-end guanylyltransferase